MIKKQMELHQKRIFCIVTLLLEKRERKLFFWIRIIERTNAPMFRTEADTLIKEGSEIVAIVSTIIKNTSRNSNK